MKFGIFYEISIPRPWTREAVRTGFENCLEQVRLADELGFDQVWAVEHHFLEEHSQSSAPDLFLTACAMQTKQIRVGHGIVICVPEINHPVRIAERAATLDILSGGRLEFGTGRSTTLNELGGFNARADTTKQSWDEFVREIPRMWTEERYGHTGQFFSMPRRAILPQPLQDPHPPMWVAVTSPGTEIDAAERGLGGLFLTFAGYAQQEEKVRRYRERIRTCEPAGKFVTNQVGLVNFLYCHEDRKQGLQTGLRLASTYTYISAQNVSVREIYPTQAYPSRTPQFRARAAIADATGDAKPPEGLCVGDPEQIIQAVKGWESIGVDRINFLLNVVDTVPQQEVLESMRLFAREVMPHFQREERPAAAGARA